MRHIWRIDDSLQLHGVEELPAGVQPKRMPEQAIDTIMVRNADVLCASLFGTGGVLLLISSMYWGAFDVGFVLRDGRVVCFENKGARASAADLRKFVRDIRQVTTEGPLYLASRWQHLKDYWDDYVVLSQRMFAGFVLGTRCDTQPDSRNMVQEAADLLGITVKQLLARHYAGADWLGDIHGPITAKSRGYLGLYDYLKAEGIRMNNGPILPVLVAPGSSLDQVSRCAESLAGSNGVQATLMNCTFYCQERPYPTWFEINVCGNFAT